MSFQPTIPLAGIAGWRFLQRTQATQEAAFEKGAELKRDIAYFEEKIGSITTPAELVADRRLLKVALGAFGLDSEIDKKAFIRKILEEGTTAPTALANRLTDKSYYKLSEAFGFGDLGGAKTADIGFAAKIVEAYKTRAFESAVGDSNNNMRLAMNFRREIAELAAGRRRQLVQRDRLQAAARSGREGLRAAEQLRQARRRQAARHPDGQDQRDVRHRQPDRLPGSGGGREDDRPLPGAGADRGRRHAAPRPARRR